MELCHYYNWDYNPTFNTSYWTHVGCTTCKWGCTPSYKSLNSLVLSPRTPCAAWALSDTATRNYQNTSRVSVYWDSCCEPVGWALYRGSGLGFGDCCCDLNPKDPNSSMWVRFKGLRTQCRYSAYTWNPRLCYRFYVGLTV